jgi:hypothetical protein
MGPQYEKKPSALLAALCNFVDAPELFASLKSAIDLKLSLHLKVLLSVCATQLLCLESYPAPLVCTKMKLVAHILDAWSVGYKDSRLFTLTDNCLPRGYKRVLQADALCSSPQNLFVNGCKFWQIVGALTVDDDSLEAVVDKYFPDDIPDEWSTVDRSKSHPTVLDVYKVQMKPEYRIKVAWGLKRCPYFKKSLYPLVKVLFKACSIAER